MTEMYQNTITNDLQQIAEMLILNGTLTACPGLVHGKMGIAIFFFQYAHFTNNMLFADYALDLIEEIQKQIHADSPADYERGIAGIGVGIEYLIRNNFLNVEDNIFEDFDKRMYRAVMYDPWIDFSLYDGLTGYGKYWISRLYQQPLCIQAQECLQYITMKIKENLQDLSEREQTDIYCFFYDLHKLSNFNFSAKVLDIFKKYSAVANRNLSYFNNNINGNIIQLYQQNKYVNNIYSDELDMALKQITILNREIPPAEMGLLAGYAGEGLLRLSTLDATNISWMQLL